MFIDRDDAGRRLGRLLASMGLGPAVVLGIPRGGVVVAAAVAAELQAPLDIVVARKLRAPWQPELAIGAVAEDGSLFLDAAARIAQGVDEAWIEAERARQMDELRSRVRRLRTIRPARPLEGRCAIVVDDGFATGATMIASLHAVRSRGPRELIAAVPVGPPDFEAVVAPHCDRAVCLLAPRAFVAVGQHYRHFAAVEDAEVAALLEAAA